MFATPLFGFTKKEPAQNDTGYYCDTSYMGDGSSYQFQQITIEFDTYTMSQVYLDRACPNYENITQLNSCVPMAGSIIVAYYDYEYEDLIPNFVTGAFYNGIFYYRAQGVPVDDMKEELYNLMGTNTINPGTSVTQFKNGLTQFLQNKNRTVSYLSCGSNILDINTATSYFNQEIPIITFLNSYEYYTLAGIHFYDNYVTMNQYSSDNGHAVVAFGYREYNFYNNGSLFQTDKYLIVCFGDGTQGLIPINNLNRIDTCLAVDIN